MLRFIVITGGRVDQARNDYNAALRRSTQSCGRQETSGVESGSPHSVLGAKTVPIFHTRGFSQGENEFLLGMNFVGKFKWFFSIFMLFDDYSCKVSCGVSFNATVNSYWLYGQARCLLTNVLYRVGQSRFDFL